MNTKVYTHEFIDIRGPHRPEYMHHMTANWSPIAQEERHQLCFGVWGVVGTTDRWPRVINLWEEDGFQGLAAGLGHETGRPNLQDAKLEKWWNEAANYRSGGFDRVMIPAPWTQTVEELTAAGIRGAVYAHEMVSVATGGAPDFLELVRDEMASAYGSVGVQLVAALRTAMADDAECILIWAFPTWESWAQFEVEINDPNSSGQLRRWQKVLHSQALAFRRSLMIDAPLSPLRIGRQPTRRDRHDDWSDT